MEAYELGDRLGQGSYGCVIKAIHKETGQAVAIKEINFSMMSKADKQMLQNEVNILKDLRSDYIVRYHTHMIDKERRLLYIVMELCSGGTLQDFITDARIHRKPISEPQIWLTLTELTLALHKCHNRRDKVVHRDIKPANTFIDSEGHVKLGDFGLAKRIGTDLTKTVCGTPLYMSPELCEHRRYGEKSDIWALGCVIYEMATLRPPFIACNEHQLREQIMNKRLDRIPEQYSEELWRIIQKMLEKNESRRWDVNQIASSRMVAITAETITLKNKRAALREKAERTRSECSALRQKIRSLERRLDADENARFN